MAMTRLLGAGLALVAVVAWAGVAPDCNRNGIPDDQDIQNGTSQDCNVNGVPDECDIANGTSPDCNGNGIPDECDLVSGETEVFATGFILPEDIVPSQGTYPAGYLVPDAQGDAVRLVAPGGGAATLFAAGPNIQTALGALIAPDEFGGEGFRLFVANLNNQLPAAPDLVLVDSAGNASAFAEIGVQTGITGITYVPVAVGGPYAGSLLATTQTDESGALTGTVYSINSSGHVSVVVSPVGVQVFTPTLAPAGFGPFANRVFMANTTGGEIVALNLQNSGITFFAVVPLLPGQVGLRQVAFSPIGWFAALHPELADDSVLVVSASGSTQGGGMNGSLSAFDQQGNLVATLTQVGIGLQFDPRGLRFTGNDLLISNGADGTLLRVTIEDFQISGDCNRNGVPDECDVANGTSNDCNGNGIPDECEPDCNDNAQADSCDIAQGISQDCNNNGIPDECDIAQGDSEDCNNNGIPDECEPDCNGNGVPDGCDIFNGTSQDLNENGIPDECDPDCNDNGVPDDLDILNGSSPDLDGNGIPDECEGAPDFEPPQETIAAGTPNFQAVGDLDGDGTVDVVAVLPGEDPQVNGQVQVFFNQGNSPSGVWQGLLAGPTAEVGRNPSAAAAGFLDPDANLDLAVTNSADDTVTILFNQGDGTFVTTSVVPVGSQPSDVVALDFNEDTFSDLAVTNKGDQSVSILLNDGLGNFEPLVGAGRLVSAFPLALSPVSLMGGDFDGNKCPDLAGAGHAPLAAAGTAGLVFVALGNGNGTFNVTNYDVGMNPQDISGDDLNGDGFPEITTADHDAATVSVLVNQGNGTFVAQPPVPVGNNPLSVDVVNLNGDGKPDLAVVAEDPVLGPAVQVLENLHGPEPGGSTPFASPIAFGVGATPKALTHADFNDDGFADLVTVNQDQQGGTGGSVSVLLNLPTACFLVTGQEIICNGNGTSFTYNVTGIVLCTGAMTSYSFSASGGAIGEEMCFKFFLTDDSGLPCCSTQVCATIPDCSQAASDPCDLDKDGVVGVHDLLLFFIAWGYCSDCGNCPSDFDGDCKTGVADMLTLLEHWD